MNVMQKSLHLNDKEIAYTHIETGSKTVCFMFSGFGYQYDKPLFYYSTMLLLHNKIDIVQIHYSYSEELFKKTVEEISNMMMKDINPVISEVTNHNQYTDTIFIGKSLGTIPMALELLPNNKFNHSKMIFLTPLLKFEPIFNSLLNSSHQGLLVIGSKDHHFNQDQIQQLMTTNLNIDVIPKANHSLDVEHFNTAESLLMLSGIMKKLEKEIKSS